MMSELPETEVLLCVYNRCHLVCVSQCVRLETGRGNLKDHLLC
jgi:hypothetical protein